MRNVGSKKDLKLRKSQFDNFLSAIKYLKDDELRNFISNVLSDSEKAIIAQRLDIIQMLLREYSYKDIIDILKVSNSTIQNAQNAIIKIEEKVNKKLLKNALEHKSSKDKKIYHYDKYTDKDYFAKSRYKGT